MVHFTDWIRVFPEPKNIKADDQWFRVHFCPGFPTPSRTDSALEARGTIGFIVIIFIIIISMVGWLVGCFMEP